MTAVSDEQWHTWRLFYRMRRRLDRELEAQLQRESSISASEYELLVALNRSADRRLRARDITAVVGWEKSRISHLVSRMEKRGLVSRTICESDARGLWITLTTDGRRTVLKAMRGHNEAIDRFFFTAMDGRQSAELRAIATSVLGALGDPTDDDSD